MPFTFKRLEIPDVFLVTPTIFKDERGFFAEVYKKEDFEKAGINLDIVQENHSGSRYGVLRGLHFQKEPYAQAKLVRCLKGRIFDVAVDIRKGSGTFGRHVSAVLSDEERNILYVPRGFAHGFMAISDDVEVVYSVDNPYSLESEGGIVWNDANLGIKWPLSSPVLNAKDKCWPGLNELHI